MYWSGSVGEREEMELTWCVWSCVTDWMTAEPFCTSSSSFSPPFFSLSSPPSHPCVSPCVLLLLLSGARWFTGLTHRGATWQSRRTTGLVPAHPRLSLRSSSSPTRADCGCLISNLIPGNKVRVRPDQRAGPGQPRDPPIIQEPRMFSVNPNLSVGLTFWKNPQVLAWFSFSCWFFFFL